MSDYIGGTDSARPVETTGLDGRPRYHMECEHCGARGRLGWDDETLTVEEVRR